MARSPSSLQNFLGIPNASKADCGSNTKRSTSTIEYSAPHMAAEETMQYGEAGKTEVNHPPLATQTKSHQETFCHVVGL